MGTRDPGVDAYILKAAEFAKPILTHLRDLAHQACPQIQEKLKWSCPHFDYKGSMCSMAAFKSHCAFGFWKASLVMEGKQSPEGAGSFGRIESLKDLPSDKVLIAYIKKAVHLNEEGIKVSAAKKPKVKKDLVIPSELSAALKVNPSASAAFEAFSNSHKKEYAEWISEAKTAETRDRRIHTAIGWISEGKSRHWKYQRC
jgi:uncharacterized protein YdeI (YjbR/CyaY-like superfamily)